MIVPLIGEAEWMPRLNGIAAWEPEAVRMLVVAPHPDDETLAAGGLIAAQRARGVEVVVTAVTDGEHAYTENEGLAALRREEQALALERLGVPRDHIVRLAMTDSSVALHEGELIERLRPLVTERTLIVAPWAGDFHPDHEACARAAAVAAREAGASVVSYFFWTWHRGTVTTLDGLSLRRFALREEWRLAKEQALACHASQLVHAPEPEILPENLLWPARMPFEVFAL